MAADDRSPSANLPIPERIRRRREDRGMTGAELARRVGVSPAYISLIESGAKVPRVRKAADIAEALGDEPAVYRAWALAARSGDADQTMRDLQHGAYWGSDRALRKLLKDGEDLTVVQAEATSADVAAGAAEATVRHAERVPAGRVPAGLPSTRVAEVPVLEAGVDPDDGPDIPEALIVDRMLVDPKLVRGERLVRPFAFLATAATTERLGGEARPGDWVVVTATSGKPAPDPVYAVRLGKRLVLSRIAVKGRTLVLMPGEGKHDVEVVALGKEGVRPHLAGRMALVVRSQA